MELDLDLLEAVVIQRFANLLCCTLSDSGKKSDKRQQEFHSRRP